MSLKVTATRAPEVSVSTTPSACRATARTSPAARHAARAGAGASSRQETTAAAAASAERVFGARDISAPPRRRRGRRRGRLVEYEPAAGVGVRVAGVAALIAEALHALEELRALLLGLQPEALALLLVPGDRLHELGLARHAVAEAGRRAAGVEAGLHEDAVLDHVHHAPGARPARGRLVETALVVGLLPVLRPLLETPAGRLDEPRPVPADDDVADDDRRHEQHHEQPPDNEQNFHPGRHGNLRRVDSRQ